MHVALVHWTFAPTTGGVESHLADLARLLAGRGCRVTVLTGERDPSGGPEYETVSLASLQLYGGRAGRRSNTELAGWIRRLQPDVVHGHNLHHFRPDPAIVLDTLRTELAFSLHHTFHETWPDVLNDMPVYRNWDGNWSVSAHVRDECTSRIGFRPELLRLPVDPARFRARRDPFEGGGPPVILHPARLLPWKGVHVSVEMLAELRRAGHEAVLVFTDTQRIADWDAQLAGYRRRVLARIRALDLEQAVRVVSPEYTGMPALYEQADVVVYPTVGEEPYGLVPLEAMSCGRPVVASRSGGIPETVVDGETGFLVERDDPVALAASVGRLLDDPAGAVQLGRSGRRRVLREFSPSRFLDALLAAYARRSQ